LYYKSFHFGSVYMT